MTNTDYFSQYIIWHETGDAIFPYRTEIDGKELVIRVNDFPEECLYTLIVDGDEVQDFDDWLENWDRSAEEKYYEGAGAVV